MSSPQVNQLTLSKMESAYPRDHLFMAGSLASFFAVAAAAGITQADSIPSPWKVRYGCLITAAVFSWFLSAFYALASSHNLKLNRVSSQSGKNLVESCALTGGFFFFVGLITTLAAITILVWHTFSNAEVQYFAVGALVLSYISVARYYIAEFALWRKDPKMD